MVVGRFADYTPPPIYDTFKERLDMFAITPTPRFEGRKRYGTSFGLLLSIVCLGIVVSYAVFATGRFLSGNRATIAIRSAKDDEATPIVPFQVNFPELLNPRYFALTVEHRTARPGQRSQKTTVPMTALANGTILRSNGGYALRGDCKLTECQYVRMKLYPCQNGTAYTPSGGCVSTDDMNAVLNMNYFVLRLDTTDVRGNVVATTFELSMKDAFSFRQIYPFHVHRLNIGPNWLTTWDPFEHTSLQPAPIIFSIDRLPRERTGDDTEYCKLDFMLSGTGYTEERTFSTSLDTMGEIAAFWGAIVGVVGIVARMFNSRTFYRKYPGWTGFSGDFERCQTEEEAAAGGTQAQQMTEVAVVSGTDSSSATAEGATLSVPMVNDDDEL